MVLYITGFIGCVSIFMFLGAGYYYLKIRSEESGYDEVSEQGIKGSLQADKGFVDDERKRRLLATSKADFQPGEFAPRARQIQKQSAAKIKRRNEPVTIEEILKQEIKNLNRYIMECQKRLEFFDGSTIETNAINTKETARKVMFTRQLIQILVKRKAETDAAVRSAGADYSEVYKNLTMPLVFVEDTYHSLISSEHIEPILWDRLHSEIQNLSRILDESILMRKKQTQSKSSF